MGCWNRWTPTPAISIPTEYKEYKQRKEGKAGIGAAVSKRYGYAAVISVIPGGPADKAEIESGDIIEAIEGKSTRDMSLAEIDGRLTGPPGSVVNVSVVRPRRALPVKSAVTLAIVVDPPLTDKMMAGWHRVHQSRRLSQGTLAGDCQQAEGAAERRRQEDHPRSAQLG